MTIEMSLTHYLGSSATPIANRIAAALGERLGITVDFDPSATDAQRRADLDCPPAGILWLCGLETTVRQRDGRLDASIVGAPVLDGRDSAVYQSVVVVGERSTAARLHDLQGVTLAINEPESWSGHHALRAQLASLGLRQRMFGRVIVTGSHEASVDALLAGVADCAAIEDAVWAARTARDPGTAALRVIARTDPWPAPPFSLVRGLDPRLEADVVDALLTMSVPGLHSIVAASDADYAVFDQGLTASRSLDWSSP